MRKDLNVDELKFDEFLRYKNKSKRTNGFEHNERRWEMGRVNRVWGDQGRCYEKERVSIEVKLDFPQE